MTIILFLIDTSASMNQRTYLGARPTLLDVAKDAVEKFLKLRQRDSASRGDRYMLLTFEEPPSNIKAGWKEHHNVFMNELKNLTASGLTSLGPAIRHCFDLLNLNRMQTGIDTYGQGRCPFFLEPSIIIVITDGGKLTCSDTVQEFSLPRRSNVPGSELTKEAYRWDQRLFALVLRLTGTPPSDHINGAVNNVVPNDISRIDAICDMTGGRSYSVSSQRSLMQCLESVVQKIQGGVVIQFEKVGTDSPPVPCEDEENQSNNSNKNGSLPNGITHQININPIVLNNSSNSSLANSNSTNNSSNNVNNLNSITSINPITNRPHWHICRKLIYVQRSAQKGYSVGHWPIPESFWPDLNSPSLPPRTAHPIVKFTCNNSEIMVIDNLPFDKYELEPSALTQYILSRKQPNITWQCFVSNSHKTSGEIGLPFGYLKASTNLTCVNLFVLPYNYPVLLPLLDELFKQHHCKPTREWKAQFDNYLKNMPLYYASPLKRALSRMGAPSNLVPDNMENCLSYSVLNYLKRLKNQAKVEFDKIVLSVGTGKPLTPSTIKVQNTGQRLTDLAFTSSTLKCRFASLKSELNEFTNFLVRLRDKNRENRSQCYRNPYDITRHDLIDQIHKMRTNFFQPLNLIKYQDEDQIHSLPISQMGNYQEYLKKVPLPLRELESSPVRQHMFGNPFKIDKKGMMVDEADIDLVGGGANGSPMRSPKRPNSPLPSDPQLPGLRFKRRPGPIPKDFVIQRPYSNNSSPSSTPPSSPLSTSSAGSISDLPSIEDSPNTPNSVSLDPLTIDISLDDENVAESDTSSVLSDDCDYTVDNQMNSINRTLLPNASPPTPSAQQSTLNTSIVTTAASANNSIPSISEPVNGRVSLTNHNGPIDDLPTKIGKRVNLNGEQIEVRRLLFKMVRRPGKNYEPLVHELSRFSGEIREYLINEVVEEAMRFKRKALIDHIKDNLTNSEVKHFIVNGSSINDTSD